MDPAERLTLFDCFPDLDDPVESDRRVDDIVGFRPARAKLQGGLADDTRVNGLDGPRGPGWNLANDWRQMDFSKLREIRRTTALAKDEGIEKLTGFSRGKQRA